jgi:hypothetical protein
VRPEISRGEMSPEERRIRSRAAQLLAGAGILHGTLSERMQVCGKETCACSRGEKHRTLVLTVRTDGTLRQIYIPKSLEPSVRQWREGDREVRELLARLSGIHQDRLVARKKKEGKRPAPSAITGTFSQACGVKAGTSSWTWKRSGLRKAR